MDSCSTEGLRNNIKRRFLEEISKFFGVNDDDDELKKLWEKRKQVHFNRFGKQKENREAYVEADDLPPVVRDSSEEEVLPHGEHALSLLFQYMRVKWNRQVQENDEIVNESEETEWDIVESDCLHETHHLDVSYTADRETVVVKETKRQVSDLKLGFFGKYCCFKSKGNVNISHSEVMLRPYFTYWLSFLQVVVLLLTIAIYPFSPPGGRARQVEEDVLVSRNGGLQIEKVGKTVVASLWIGPSLETLILLGAKYAPCMRRDKLIFEKIEEERNKENNTGCCMQTMNSGCIQRLQYECVSSMTRFKKNSVCGQDPMACSRPASVYPKEWDESIIKWPICRKTIDKSSLDKEKFPHMHCTVTGRPCCIGTQAQCIITSQDYCRFRGGVYHPDKTLCSQVNCLTSTCGLLPFINDEAPDQFYRLYLSLFIHAGIFHLAITLVINIVFLRYMEKLLGCVSVLLIYLLSGIGGNLWSGVIIPYEPEVGPGGALCGIFAIDFVLFFSQWSKYKSPWRYFGYLAFLLVCLIIAGFLPYIDNYAHMFGFLYGLLLSPLVIQDILKSNRTHRIILLIVCIIIFLTLNIVGFILFYSVQTVGSDAIKYFNCIPLDKHFCQNYHQGLYLEPRATSY